MIMIIVISQSKLLHCVGLWIWHTSKEESNLLLQHFTNTLKWWFVIWCDSSAV